MAAGAGVPLIPMAVWGTQRMWTKGRPRKLVQRHLPVTILVGEPMHPDRRDDQTEVTNELRARITALVDKAQQEYPDQPAKPEDAWWLPAHLGGTAPAPPAPVAVPDSKDGTTEGTAS
jgi:1-acyl-sn-glycerol-3-phosphate acyltransferase